MQRKSIFGFLIVVMIYGDNFMLMQNSFSINISALNNVETAYIAA